MEKSSIDFDLAGIASQLKIRKLAVPIYQRPYSWEEEQVREFWADLKLAFQRSKAEYFLGTVVLAKSITPSKDTIIDGQQRLATTAMLLAAIRDEFAARGDAKRASIAQSEFLSSPDMKSGQDEPKLRLSSEDDFFFRRLIVESDQGIQPSRKSHLRISAAYKLLRDFIESHANDAGSEWATRLLSWIDFLGDDVRVMVLDVPTEADAFLIFETLNDRGADLTIADLLKNYLFSKAGPALDTVRDGWIASLNALEITAENSTFTTFLRHYWSSRHGAVRERELFKHIRDHVTNEAQALAFVAELQQAARLYAALLNSDHEYWSQSGFETRENVETLLRFELEQLRPLLLAGMQYFTRAELVKLIRAVISWSVRGLIVGGVGGGTYEKAYCEAAVRIRNGEAKTWDDLFEKGINKLVPSDDEFSSAFSIARVQKSNLARYYLIALEGARMGDPEPELVPNANEDQVNLEHVLPKSPTPADWGSAFNADERRDWVYRIGNLALLKKGPNGRIGNKPFSVKKPILAASQLQLTSEIGAEADWTPKAIQERQVRLASLAVGVWPRRL